MGAAQDGGDGDVVTGEDDAAWTGGAATGPGPSTRAREQGQDGVTQKVGERERERRRRQARSARRSGNKRRRQEDGDGIA